MSKKQENNKGAPQKPAGGGHGAKAHGPENTGPQKCKFVDCKSNSKKFGFCMEHYELYMSGVIKGDGTKPVDFAEKLALHLAKSKKVA
jgi:hypothetical protein